MFRVCFACVMRVCKSWLRQLTQTILFPYPRLPSHRQRIFSGTSRLAEANAENLRSSSAGYLRGSPNRTETSEGTRAEHHTSTPTKEQPGENMEKARAVQQRSLASITV